MEDIFSDMEKQSNSSALDSSTPAMSIHHEPASEFDKKVAREIASWKPSNKSRTASNSAAADS